MPRLLGLLDRNISSSSYGSFDREYWHYNTVDFSCARKQEAVLTLTLLYLLEHKENRYYRSTEIFDYIRAALIFWTRIQNANGSFNEWYPNEHSFVVTSFSAYAVSESLLLIRGELREDELQSITDALMKAGNWLIARNETRVMNQQTGAVLALLNIHLLSDKPEYLESSREKVALLNERQSEEGWFIEYGGPDIGYLSLAIDYLSKYFSKTNDDLVKGIITRSLKFIKHFIQPNLVAGGEYTSRNTEYLIPHGFEIFSRHSEDAVFVASAVRKSMLRTDSFPHVFDDRYLTYVGYTWLQAYRDANTELDGKEDAVIEKHFNNSFKKHYRESGLMIVNDKHKHLIMNLKKGGAFRLFDKKSERAYSDSGVLARSDGKWFTSGWLSETQNDLDEDSITVSGTMWKVPDKALTPLGNIVLRIFQMTFGRSAFISLWIKERLRDILITKTRSSDMEYTRTIKFKDAQDELLSINDRVTSGKRGLSSLHVFSKDTHIYVPSSRYYVEMKESPFQKIFSPPVNRADIGWKISSSSGVLMEKSE